MARERIRQDLNHDTCPISLDDLCREAAEFGDLVARIAASVSRRGYPPLNAGITSRANQRS